MTNWTCVGINIQKLPVLLVLSIIIMIASGSLGAQVHYSEATLKNGADGFAKLTGDELSGFLINRTTLVHHKSNKKVKIYQFYHQSGYKYLKILGVKKYKGEIFKSAYQLRDGASHTKSIVNGKPVNVRFYRNGHGLVWTCGGTKKGCNYYIEESWDGDPQNLKN
jgi:hypothetical protein